MTGITAGKLFVDLAVKGRESAGKAVTGIREGLHNAASAGLAAKAALLAVVYGVERFSASAAGIGEDLMRFASVTGLSTDRLQRWQHLARLSGVSADEMTSAIQGVQQAMVDMITTGKAPSGLAVIADTVGGIDPARYRDTFYVMDKLREFAQATKDNPDVANQFLRSIIPSDSVIHALRTSRVELDKIRPSNILGTGEYVALSRINSAWEQFWHNWKMFGTRLVVENGGELISNLQRASNIIFEVVTNIRSLLKEVPALKAALMIIGGIIFLKFKPLATIVAGLIYLLSELQKMRSGKENLFGNIGSGVSDWMKEAGDIIKNDPGGLFKTFMDTLLDSFKLDSEPHSSNTTINNSFKFSQNVNGGPVMQERAFKDIFRSGIAQLEGSLIA